MIRAGQNAQAQTADLTAQSTDDQSAVVAFLADPATYGQDIAVERIDTHGAMVFLAGKRAYKIKRAVRFPYMDFSTLALRRRACEREVELNRRTAPELYIGAVPVTRDRSGTLALNGTGEEIEWVVVMRRFAQDALCDRLARAGQLTPALACTLADEVAAFHERAEPLHGADAAGGGAAGLKAVIDENLEELRGRPEIFARAEVATLAKSSAAALARIDPLLEARLAAGMVRRCHGDLHLRNVCIIDGRPRLFDCIEFNDSIACIDVLYDLSFLLMDLEHRGHRSLANLILNRYLHRRDELAGLAALPLFLATRATIRAKTSVSTADRQSDKAAAQKLRDEAANYLNAANRYLQPAPPMLVAIGGLSGTGKTSVARELAPALGASPGAVHVRSDVVRKTLHGVDELARLPAAAYGSEETAAVYADMGARAGAALAAGHTVIADAVFAKPAERAEIEAIAGRSSVPFVGIWLEAPAETIVGRVAARRGDASDATPAVVKQQLTYDVGPLSWRRVDASNSLSDVAEATTEEIAKAQANRA